MYYIRYIFTDGLLSSIVCLFIYLGKLGIKGISFISEMLLLCEFIHVTFPLLHLSLKLPRAITEKHLLRIYCIEATGTMTYYKRSKWHASFFKEP